MPHAVVPPADSPTAARPAPETPDFDHYPIVARILGCRLIDDGRVLSLTWSDGRESRLHAIWLRDNATDPTRLNPETREPWGDVTAIPAGIRILSAVTDGSGSLVVTWSSDDATSVFHQGWLHAHDYSNPAPDVPEETVIWSGETLAEPPTVDGRDVLEDDDALEAWVRALHSHGIARLTGVPTVEGMVGRVAGRIGTVRDSNFGRVFDVRVQAGPGSNAYSSAALTPHTDLPTREYMPGLQFLHCFRSSTAGGQAIMVDGLHVARTIRERDPEAYRLLTEPIWPFSNRALDTDYRFRTAMIRLDPTGAVAELRVAAFLQAPLSVPFNQVEPAYRALRVLFEELNRPANQLRFAYAPGDLVGFDNRRVLHGREAFDAGPQDRWLQGCYGEREELLSRLRILERRRRAATCGVGA